MLEISWKSFGNHCRPCFEVIENLFTPSVIVRKSWKSLETFGDLGKSFKIFGNLWKPSVNLRKFRFCGDEKSHAFYWKKVGRYMFLPYFSGSLERFSHKQCCGGDKLKPGIVRLRISDQKLVPLPTCYQGFL